MDAASGIDLEAFMVQHYARAVAAVGMITGNRQDAADAVQDALVGVLARPPRTLIDNPAAWIIAVASNRERDRHRGRAAEARALARLGATAEGVDDRIEILDVDLRDAVIALPPQQRRICALHYLADQSVDSIAKTLGVSAGTVKTQLYRARRSLAAVLDEELSA